MVKFLKTIIESFLKRAIKAIRKFNAYCMLNELLFRLTERGKSVHPDYFVGPLQLGGRRWVDSFAYT